MRKSFCLLALALSIDLFAYRNVTFISNQTQFEEAITRINNGENMHLVLNNGQYILKQSLVAKVPVSIEGGNSIITSAFRIHVSQQTKKTTQNHNIYNYNSPLGLFPLFYDCSGKIIPISESVIDSTRVNYVNGDIIAPNDYGEGVMIKIPIPDNLKHLRNQSFSMAFGYFDCGWTVVNFQLDRADSMYFYCTTLTECYTNNYQYDKKVYKKPVRFVLYNAEVKTDAIFFDKEYLYVPKGIDDFYYLNQGSDEINVPTLRFNSDVKISNVVFCGIGGIVVNSKSENICNFNNCQFRNTLGCPLAIYKNQAETLVPAIISTCSFKNCAVYENNVLSLKSDYGDNTFIRVMDCEITRYPDDVVLYKNVVPLVNISGNVLISQNVIYNNCRGLLGLNRGRIIAKDNFLYNKDSFYRLWDRNTSNDWGLIYCNHIFRDTEEALHNSTHCILLENNLLYGAYAYGGDARGIFIDDGRGDVVCRGNIILNTQIYSIDARNARLIEASSARNSYEKNIVTSNYRLQSGPVVEGSDIPVTRANVLLTSIENDTTKVEVVDKDTRIRGDDMSFSFSESRIYLSKELYRIIRKSSAWRKIKKHVKRM